MGAPSNIDGEKLRYEHDKLVDENIRLNMQIKNIKREVLFIRVIVLDIDLQASGIGRIMIIYIIIN
jgi:hypothetical protein